MRKRKQNLREKGITLVALVVTIIILLILAGVTIRLAIGDRGIFKMAQNAVDAYEQSAKNEALDMEGVEKYLGKLESGTQTTPGGGEEGGLSASDLKERLDGTDGKDSVVGKKVTGLTGEVAEKYEWDIFYADDTNIYLITKDCININDCPSKNGKTVSRGQDEFDGNFRDVADEYNGTEDVKYEEIWMLDKEFFGDSGKLHASNSYDGKCIAYLLDYKIWTNKFILDTLGSKVDFVIGSPTVQLLLKSFNSKYNKSYKARVSDDSTEYHGQCIYSDTGESTEDAFRVPGTNNFDDSYSTTNSSGYWISSLGLLTFFNTIGVCYGLMSWDGRITDGSGMGLGFRPVVRLNSSIELRETTPGEFEIM